MAQGVTRVLLIGGSGYIGRFLIERCLAETDWTVWYTSRGSSIAVDSTRLHHVACDLTDSDSVKRCIEASVPHVVVNLAATSSPVACEKDPEAAVRVNSPTPLLDAMSEASDPPVLIQFSTDQVYCGTKAPYKECPPASLAPINAYGRSKADFERKLEKATNIPSRIVLRCSNVYGPKAPYGGGGKFLQFVEEGLQGTSPLELYTDETRSYIYVNDVCKTVLSVAKASLAGGLRGFAVFNMGGPNPLTRLDFGEAVLRHRGCSATLPTGDHRLRGVPKSEASFRPACEAPADITMDSTLLAHTVGFVPKPLPDALREMP